MRFHGLAAVAAPAGSLVPAAGARGPPPRGSGQLPAPMGREARRQAAAWAVVTAFGCVVLVTGIRTGSARLAAFGTTTSSTPSR
jgi:hypothetical protein